MKKKKEKEKKKAPKFFCSSTDRPTATVLGAMWCIDRRKGRGGIGWKEEEHRRCGRGRQEKFDSSIDRGE